MSTATFDQEAFYPFRALLQGGLTDAGDLLALERFLRAIVLHDEMLMVGEPMLRPGGPQPEEEQWAEEEAARGARNVIVGFAPVLDDRYNGILTMDRRAHEPSVEPSGRLVQLATKFSGAGPGDAYYKAHLGYMQHLADVLAAGGSVVCEGPVGKEAFEETKLPERLFATLDGEWGAYIHAAEDGLGFTLPPVLAIVLSRAARRDAIPAIVRDLRNEWSEPRRKVWALIGILRHPDTTPKQAYEVQGELKDAERLFSPTAGPPVAPLRLIFEVFGSGSLQTVVSEGTKAMADGATAPLAAAGRYWFRSGAFDLARRVRTELLRIDSVRGMLTRHLSNDEQRALGL